MSNATQSAKAILLDALRSSRQPDGAKAMLGASDHTVTAIRSSINQAYGGLLTNLEDSGLVTLVQTYDEAIDAAARARAALDGSSLTDARAMLALSVKNSTKVSSCDQFDAASSSIDKLPGRLPNDEQDLMAPEFHEDIPNESWLKGKVDYAVQAARSRFGVPKMGSATGYFSAPVMVPVRWAKDLKGERAEQSNVRQHDLDAIRNILRDTGKFPLMDSGKEYVPYIEIGYDGVPWVNEGNHRIMAAAAEGLDYIPVELRYFDGGQRFSGKWCPDNLIEITNRVLGESLLDETMPARDSVMTQEEEQKHISSFERWFGNSKVVNGEGKPLLVYHGYAGEAFHTFEDKYLRKHNDNIVSGLGFFFTPNIEIAQDYAFQASWNIAPDDEAHQGDDQKMHEVYLSLQNPVVIDASNINGDEDGAIKIADLVESAKNAGYDGAIIKSWEDGSGSDDQYIAFNPFQIKSATDNTGDFDRSNPDMRFSRRDSMGFRGHDNSVQGFYDPQTGQSFLIAANLTPATAAGVFMHEVGIHMVSSPEMQPVFERARKLVESGQDPFLTRVHHKMKEVGESSGEEAAAYLVEAYEQDRLSAPPSVSQWFSDFVSMVRAWAFTKGHFMEVSDLTVSDIAALARVNAKSMAKNVPPNRVLKSQINTGMENFKAWFNISKEIDRPYEKLGLFRAERSHIFL